MIIISVDFHQMGNFEPYIFKTVDFGCCAEYVEWGVIYTPLPDNPEYAAFGDVGDYLRYQDSPREFHFGLRMKF